LSNMHKLATDLIKLPLSIGLSWELKSIKLVPTTCLSYVLYPTWISFSFLEQHVGSTSSFKLCFVV
jgi:hypothetical protein